MNEEVLTPADEREAAEIIAAAEAPLDIVGAGTRSGFGRPPQSGRRLSTTKLTGIVFHEPAEMTLRARAGTPLAEVEASLFSGTTRCCRLNRWTRAFCSKRLASRPSAA